MTTKLGWFCSYLGDMWRPHVALPVSQRNIRFETPSHRKGPTETPTSKSASFFHPLVGYVGFNCKQYVSENSWGSCDLEVLNIFTSHLLPLLRLGVVLLFVHLYICFCLSPIHTFKFLTKCHSVRFGRFDRPRSWFPVSNELCTLQQASCILNNTYS